MTDAIIGAVAMFAFALVCVLIYVDFMKTDEDNPKEITIVRILRFNEPLTEEERKRAIQDYELREQMHDELQRMYDRGEPIVEIGEYYIAFQGVLRTAASIYEENYDERA